MSDEAKNVKELGAVLLGCFGAVVVVLGLYVVAVVVDGFVAMHLWRWFIAPLTGWPVLTVWQAAGLATVVGWLTFQMPRTTDQRTTAEKWWAIVEMLFTRPLVVLAMGAVLARLV